MSAGKIMIVTFLFAVSFQEWYWTDFAMSPPAKSSSTDTQEKDLMLGMVQVF